MKVILVFGAALLGAALRLPAQTEQPPRAKELWNSEFSKLRPPRPEAAGTVVRSEVQSAEAMVGITVWRLRPAAPADAPGIKLLVHEPERSREYTPERVDAGTPLAEGARVRLGIESARAGYLYVISCERYADGSRGDPYLIFPTERILGGDNRVRPGLVIGLPAWDDHPPYLTLRHSRPDHVAEVLLLLVTPNPLPELRPERNAVRLDPQRVLEWERRWGASADSLNGSQNLGTAITAVEHEASTGTHALHPDDPLPQTLYRIKARPGAPYLIVTELKVR